MRGVDAALAFGPETVSAKSCRTKPNYQSLQPSTIFPVRQLQQWMPELTIQSGPCRNEDCNCPCKCRRVGHNNTALPAGKWFFRHGAAENDPVHATEGEELAMRTGLYPGTFDPMTLGHLDIIRRACSLVDRLVVGVAMNMEKSPLFELEERVAMVEAEAALLQKETGTAITAHPFENLLIDCANEVGASVIIRGLRAVSDFEYEYQMVGMNRALESGVETVFLMADAKCQVIASKLVKEIARLGGDISTFVSPQVESSVRQKFVTG